MISQIHIAGGLCRIQSIIRIQRVVFGLVESQPTLAHLFLHLAVFFQRIFASWSKCTAVVARSLSRLHQRALRFSQLPGCVIELVQVKREAAFRAAWLGRLAELARWVVIAVRSSRHTRSLDRLAPQLDTLQ